MLSVDHTPPAPTDHTPVAIVGAGPVGLTLALLLARQGVPSVVLERHQQAYSLPRAVHLDDVALRILQAAGIGHQVVDAGRPMPGMRLLDAQLRTMVSFTRDEHTPGTFGYHQSTMVHQPDLDGFLAARAGLESVIDVRRGADVTAVSVPAGAGGGGTLTYTADATSHRLSADWVVGADGANSMIRTAIGGRLRDLGVDERWLIVDVATDRPLDIWGGVHQVCDPLRPVTFMQVVGTRYRWEFRLHPDEDASALAARVPALLAPWTTGVEVTVVRAAEYTFRARVAHAWRAGPLLIAGDAAHQTPPFIGHGLGAGLRDAENLAWKLAAALQGADVLDTYGAERAPQVTAAIRASKIVGWMLTGGQQRAAMVRRQALIGIGRIPRASAAAAQAASPRLTPGPLVRRRRGDPRDGLTGTLCPQPFVGSDEALGTAWCVLSRAPITTELPALTLAQVDPRARPALAHWLAAGRAYAVLLRPDHIVAAVARSPREIEVMLAVATPTHRQVARMASRDRATGRRVAGDIGT